MIGRLLLASGLLLSVNVTAWGWGQEGHSIVAEIANRRLTPQASAEVARLLGPNHTLASVASWADDERDGRPETYNWHFVDIHIADNTYSAAKDCHPQDDAAKGDCIVAELTQLRSDLRCASNDDQKRDALRFAVHFIGDVHQPLHTVFEALGGNQINVTMNMVGSLSCGGRPCKPRVSNTNFMRPGIRD